MVARLRLAFFIAWLAGVGGFSAPFACAAEEPAKAAADTDEYEQALQKAQEVRRKQAVLQRELYVAQRERFALKQSDEDQQRLAESRATVEAAFAQAGKLAGDREAVAWQKIQALHTDGERKYAHWQALGDACGSFADQFPYSTHAEEVLKDAFFAHFALGRFLQDDNLRKRLEAPPTNNPPSLACQKQLIGLSYLAVFNARFPIKGTNGSSTSIRYREEVTMLYKLMPTAEQVAEVHLGYGLTYDERPDLSPHSDFLRLDYLSHKKDRAGFIKLLGQMQSRWKPDDPHWQTTSAEALRQLCDLVQSDPRGTNFYWWLRGKREIGTLP